MFCLLCFVTAFVWLENSVDGLYWTSRFTCVEFARYIKSQIFFLKANSILMLQTHLKKSISTEIVNWMTMNGFNVGWKCLKPNIPQKHWHPFKITHHFSGFSFFNEKTDVTMMEKIHTHANVITNANTKFPNAVVNYWNLFRSQGQTDWMNCIQNECEHCYIGGICICVWVVMNVKCITQLPYEQTLWNMLNYH